MGESTWTPGGSARTRGDCQAWRGCEGSGRVGEVIRRCEIWGDAWEWTSEGMGERGSRRANGRTRSAGGLGRQREIGGLTGATTTRVQDVMCKLKVPKWNPIRCGSFVPGKMEAPEILDDARGFGCLPHGDHDGRVRYRNAISMEGP